ncbi:hypothetical protein FRC07_014535 [Ceratobasidium sp. 392]|nr:hypothetical protein FRC07_014535 [Ceratobasidium sp. 392]
MTTPTEPSGRSLSTLQDSRFSRLESGATLVSVNAPELERVSSLTATTDPNLVDGHQRTPSLPEDTKTHADYAQQSIPLPIWKQRLLHLLNTYPRIRRGYEWLGGPVPPVVLQPTPKLDSATIRWRAHTVHVSLSLESWWLNHTRIFRRTWLFFLFVSTYIVGLALLSRTNTFMTPSESFIDCTSAYWLKDDGCGLNGQLCSPFTGPDFQFRCPGNCLSVTLANPRTVGVEQVVYESLVVGGGDGNKTYRGDSWICPAAIQAGLVSPRVGGCGALRAFGTFLPTLFVGYALWRSAWRFTLPAFESMPLERVVWYLAPFWAGVHFNVLTAKIPVDRLVASDIRRPGAVTALVIIAIVVAAIVVNQARVIRKTRALFYYLSWYILAGVIVAILASLPTLTFRLHHYIAAIVLTPLTAFPTRLSAIYQAFLLGMFLQGVAKFGFDSILQTAAELRRDAPLGSSLPAFVTNSTITFPASLANVSVAWSPISTELTDTEGWNGFSLLVDDVQRLTGQALSYSLAELQVGIPHFFRLAYQRDGQSGDYTKAAILFPNGTWSDPLPGPS